MNGRRLRQISRLVLLAAGLAAAGGCGKHHRPWLGVLSTGRHIDVLLPLGYFSDDIFAEFERDYGVQVHPTYFSHDSELYRILTGGDPQHRSPFALAMPSAFVAERLDAEGRLAPFIRSPSAHHYVNLTNLNPPDTFGEAGQTPRQQNLDTSENLRIDPDNDFIVPYIWGTIGIGYNAERVSSLPRSWANLFDLPPDRPYRIALIDDAHLTLGSALIYEIAQRYRGSTLSSEEIAHQVQNEVTHAGAAEIRKAGEIVKALGKRVVCINNDHIPELLALGDVDVALAQSGDVAVAMLKGQVTRPAPGLAPANRNLNIRIALPSEGVIVFRDCFVIPKGASAQARADGETFLNFLVNPEIAGAISNFSCYATTIKSGAANVLPAISNSAAFFINPYRSRNLFLEDIDGPATDRVYAEVWAEVRKSFPPGIFKYPPDLSRDLPQAPEPPLDSPYVAPP